MKEDEEGEQDFTRHTIQEINEERMSVSQMSKGWVPGVVLRQLLMGG